MDIIAGLYPHYISNLSAAMKRYASDITIKTAGGDIIITPDPVDIISITSINTNSSNFKDEFLRRLSMFNYKYYRVLTLTSKPPSAWTVGDISNIKLEYTGANFPVFTDISSFIFILYNSVVECGSMTQLSFGEFMDDGITSTYVTSNINYFKLNADIANEVEIWANDVKTDVMFNSSIPFLRTFYISIFEDAIIELQNRVTDVEAEVTVLGNSLNNLATTIDNVAQTITTYDGRLQQIEDDILSFNGIISQIQQDQAGLNQTFVTIRIIDKLTKYLLIAAALYLLLQNIYIACTVAIAVYWLL